MKKVIFTFSVFTALVLTANAQLPSDSLIAHFPMDGDGVDIIGNLSPIMTQGMPMDTSDRYGDSGKALWFNGNSFYSYGDVLDMDSVDFSISLWCRVEQLTINATHHDYPMSKGTTIFGNPDYSGYAFGFRDENPDTLSVAALWSDQHELLRMIDVPTEFNTWHHLVLSRCANFLSLTQNGVVIRRDTLLANSDLSTNVYFSIGANDRAPNGTPNGFFNGAIDDIRIYKGRCLDECEIQQLFDTCVSVSVEQNLSYKNEYSWTIRHDVLNLSYPNRSVGLVDIFSMDGRLIYSRYHDLARVNISLAAIKNGVFIVRLGDGKRQQSFKILRR